MITSAQLLGFLHAWEEGEATLEPAGDYARTEHGFAVLQDALQEYVWFRSEPMDAESFEEVARFFKQRWGVISELPLPGRLMDLARAASEGTLLDFERAARIRLVIAGHDLKFIQHLLPRFKEVFEVRLDHWSGHNAHDEKLSGELLEWGDLIWAEWLLGAAVWYSRRVTERHRMVVRTHRSEMTVAYGDALRVDKVGAVIAVSPHCLRDFADRFDLPPSRMRLIPLGFDVDGYQQGTDPERIFRLAMVGALPKLKGLRRALELLVELRRTDPRFTLTIYGKRPEELKWVWGSPGERTYYESCERFIAEHGLSEHVRWGGWMEPRITLAQHGVVLSLSDLEAFHAGPTEAFCSGGVGLFLQWRGVEDIHPAEFIFPNTRELALRILELRKRGALDAASARGRDFVRAHYSALGEWEAIAATLRAVSLPMGSGRRVPTRARLA